MCYRILILAAVEFQPRGRDPGFGAGDIVFRRFARNADTAQMDFAVRRIDRRAARDQNTIRRIGKAGTLFDPFDGAAGRPGPCRRRLNPSPSQNWRRRRSNRRLNRTVRRKAP